MTVKEKSSKKKKEKPDNGVYAVKRVATAEYERRLHQEKLKESRKKK